MAGLEPARISPHAPQTCAYTDSATSTQTILFNFQSLFCFVLVAEQSLSLLPSPQKQHLVAFSSAECHIGHKYIIMDKSPCQFKNLSFVFFKYQRSVVSAKAERIGQCTINISLNCLMRNIIQIGNMLILIIKVDCRRNNAFVNNF